MINSDQVETKKFQFDTKSFELKIRAFLFLIASGRNSLSATFNAIHKYQFAIYLFFHLNSSFKCNIMIYVLALALSNYQNNLVSRDTIDEQLPNLIKPQLIR